MTNTVKCMHDTPGNARDGSSGPPKHRVRESRQDAVIKHGIMKQEMHEGSSYLDSYTATVSKV